MTEITSSTQLSLLFPNANKAMSKVLEQASPQQLKTLSEAKDLKAVLSQLMSDTLDVSKSNKIILDILKNSNIFKELGSFPQELKALIELLEADAKNPSNTKIDKILQTLKLSLLDFKQIDEGFLKDFIKNSGVFLESKFIQDKNPKLELQTALEQLRTSLGQSEQKGISHIIKDIDALLKNETIFSKTTGVKTLEGVKNELSSLLSNLKEAIKSADPLYSKDIQKLVVKLENLSQQPNKNEAFSLSTLKNIVQELSDELRISAKNESKPLLSQLNEIQSKLTSIQKENTSLTLLKTLSSSLQTLDLKSLDKLDIKELKTLIEESKTLSKMKFEDIEALKTDEIQSFFTNISDKISPLNTQSTKSIFDIIEKILSSLKQPQQGFEELKVPKDIKNWIAGFEKEIAKGDILFSKAMQTQLDKISHFSSPAHLLDNKLLQESLQKDMKALLLGLEKELGNTPTTHTNELLKSVDKLLMQVDYFQLMSHLSNASYLYLPYHWEGLDNGQFSFKNKKDGSCYCEIDLELKEYGKLNMILQLFEENQLNMMIYTQKKELKDIFKNNIKKLRASLTSVNVMPRNIHLFELDGSTKKPNPYGKGAKLDELGFEVKG